MICALKMVTGWGWVFLALTVYVVFYALFPTSSFIKLNDLKVRDHSFVLNMGKTQKTSDYPEPLIAKHKIVLFDQSVFKDFTAGYTVFEQVKQNENQWLDVARCSNNSVIYEKRSRRQEIAVPVNLWAWGDCSKEIKSTTPPLAELRLCAFYSVWILPLKFGIFRKDSEPICSNIYKGRLLP